MTLFNKLVSGSAVNLVDHVARVVVIFVTTPLMIHHLGEKTYGVWLLAVAISGYLKLLDLGLSFAGTRFMGHAIGAGDETRIRSLHSDLQKIFKRLSLLAVVATSLLVWLIPMIVEEVGGMGMFRLLVLGLGFLTAIRFRFQIYEMLLKSHVRYDLIGWASVGRTVFQGGGVLFVLLAGHGLSGLLIVHLSSEIFYLGIIAAKARIYQPPDLSAVETTGEQSWALIRFGAARMAILGGDTLRSGIDPLIIARVSGVDMVPVYNVGRRFLDQFDDLMNTLFGGAIFAALSQIEGSGDHKRLNERFLAGCRLSSALAGMVAGGLLLFGPPFIERWVGPGFVDSGKVLLILVPGMLLRSMQMPAAGLFLSKAKHHQQAILMLAGGALNLVLSILLAQKIGFFGVVWATLVELVLVFGVAMPVLVSRLTGIPVLTYAKTLLKGVVKLTPPFFLFFFGLKPWISPDYLALGVAGGLYLLICLPILWFLVLNPVERRGILELATGRWNPAGRRNRKRPKS